MGVPEVSPYKAASIVIEQASVSPHALFMSYKSRSSRKTEETEWYPRPDGSLYICSGEEIQPTLPEYTSEVEPSKEKMQWMKETVKEISPKLLEDATAVKEQACYLPNSKDGVPIIGKLRNVEGAYVATGHSVWGILNSPATGKAMAELIVDGKSTFVDLSKFDPSRFL